MIRKKLIRETVSSLLAEGKVTGPIIDVRALAKLKGAQVVEEPIAREDFSGFLFHPPDAPPVIGVNARHAITRKRFTIAHELGHLLLHPMAGVHVDRAMLQMRDSKASEGTDCNEIEANRFAAELLMPHYFLETDVRTMTRIHADDEKAIGILAKKYGVSPQAMTIRLASLNFFWM
jgi:Zn-dependent peptidase ImmA (M78 family)